MNLLYLVHRMPYPPNRGDRIRSYHLLRYLAARHRVWLATLADEPVPAEHLRMLAEWCEQVAVVPLGRNARWLRAAVSLAAGGSASVGLFAAPRLRRVVANWARRVRFDAAVAFCSTMVPYLNLTELARVPALVDLVDVDSQKWFDYGAAAGPLKRFFFALEGSRVLALEREAARRAAALAVVSEPEAELCRGHCAPTPVYAIANGVDFGYFGEVPPLDDAVRTEPHCVFVGALDYKANVEAVVWFCREVWPELLRRHPRATFAAVGRRPVPAVRRLGELPGVNVAADVPDVRPFLARADVAVAPLRVARGIQNKVLEALAAGRAVVATAGALEGIELEVGRHALRADEPNEWVAALSQLFDDHAMCARLGAAGRAYVEAHHAWEARLRPFDELISSLCPALRDPVAAAS